MNNNTIDLEKLTVTELKSLAYDRIAMLENAKRELEMINSVIQRKNEQPAEAPPQTVPFSLDHIKELAAAACGDDQAPP